MRPLEEIGVNIVTIKKLVASVCQGLGEPSTIHYSYMSCVDYDKYREDQKKQKTTIDRLDKAYSSFMASHRDLRRAYKNMIT